MRDGVAEMRMDLDLAAPADLRTRLRLAIVHNDVQELEVLNPIIRGLSRGLVRLGEIEALDVEVAQRLVFAREKAVAATRLGGTGGTGSRESAHF